MSFLAYPDYRHSGIGWVDELPAHWKTVALKWVSRIYAGGTPDKNKVHYWENGAIPWLNSGAVNQVLITRPSSYITDEAFRSSSARWIPAGSLVIALAGQGKTKAMVAQLAIETTCNQSMAAIVPGSILVPRYLFWWLSSNYQNIRNMAGGDLRDGLNLELVGNIAALVPTEVEQTQIARFLDHETARIDALIEEQQRLIELLKEKRQAVISHAVTKGLDPTVPMKDSGVEWLGEVPAHWNVIRLGQNIRTRKGFAFSAADFSDEGAAVVKASDIKNQSINEPSTFIGFEFLKKTPNAILKKGNLVLSTVGSTPDVKNSAVGQIGCVPDHLDGALLNQNTVIFEPANSKVTSEYLFFALLTTAYRDHLDLNAHGTANQASLSLSDMLSFCIPLPDLDEQKAISSELSRVLENVKALERESQSLVGLLTERRSALISAAVTGKIDVRGWQPPASAQAPELAVAEAV